VPKKSTSSTSAKAGGYASRSNETFTFQLIGQRGVGKTVFLATMSSQYNDLTEYGLCSADVQTENQVQQILTFMRNNGSYPPATNRSIPFTFDLYPKGSSQSRKPLCTFRWEDIPGEICQLWDEGFNNSTANSSGCLIFVDANALMANPNYTENLDQLNDLLLPLVNIVALNSIAYPVAIVLTKCDMVGTLTTQIMEILQERLQPITRGLKRFNITHKVFYSSLTLTRPENTDPYILTVGNTESPLLWLIEEIQRVRKVPVLVKIAKLLGLRQKRKNKGPRIFNAY
jgi:GTPase SAR1 family protein